MDEQRACAPRKARTLDLASAAWLLDQARNVGAVRAAAAVTAGKASSLELDGGMGWGDGWRFPRRNLNLSRSLPSWLPIASCEREEAFCGVFWNLFIQG